MTMRLEEIPEPLDLGEDRGRSRWHDNAEMRCLIRPMTRNEYLDHCTFDRSLYRLREEMMRTERERKR